MVQSGRDVFVVNFSDGSASLNDNAAKVERVIQEINKYKLGSSPLAVVGYSMGGVIARKALKNMEVKGVDHQTSVYISYDAPHLGANIPKTIITENERLISYIDSKSAGYTPSDLSRSRKLYRNAAASEMMLFGSNFIPASPSDFPNKPVRIAVTSGSMSGGGQPNPAYNGEHVAAFCVGEKIYDPIFHQIELASFCYDMNYTSSDINSIYYDDTPGSYFTMNVGGYKFTVFDAVLERYRTEANRFALSSLHAGKTVSFIPTTSSLAIFNVEPHVDARSRLDYSPFDYYIAISSSSNPCSDFYAQVGMGYNADHSIFDWSQLTQINCAINQYQNAGVIAPSRLHKKY